MADPTSPNRKFNKFNESARKKYLEAIQKGNSKTDAADTVGVDRTTVWQYIKAHPEFEDEIYAAQELVIDLVEAVLLTEALGGNMRAIEFFLTNRKPSRWADKKGSNLRPIQETLDITPAVLEVLENNPEAQLELKKRLELEAQ